jgi:hypothetical protein
VLAKDVYNLQKNVARRIRNTVHPEAKLGFSNTEPNSKTRLAEKLGGPSHGMRVKRRHYGRPPEGRHNATLRPARSAVNGPGISFAKRWAPMEDASAYPRTPDSRRFFPRVGITPSS